MYRPLNIFIALKGVIIWNKKNEIEMPKNIGVVLQNFFDYRKTKLLKDFPNDNAQLITNLALSQSVVGVANLGTMCSTSYSAAVTQNYADLVSVAGTVAHEMGHNFGMEHDKPSCFCPNKNGCLMATRNAYNGEDQWSHCSKESLKNFLYNEDADCLKNKPENLFGSPTCGNGFLEPGEECDCGLPLYCHNKCCDPNTCMLFSNATCASGSCCDLTTCQVSPAYDVCREAPKECDLPEFCDGESEFCPDDVYKHNSEECGNGKAFCFNGECKSHDDQCRKIWGFSATSVPECYQRLNIKGNDDGNCGLDLKRKGYKPCPLSDVMCGKLHCKSNSDEPSEKYQQFHMSTNGFGSTVCKEVQIPPEIGFVSNGVKCGTNKVCLNFQCVDIIELKLKCSNCNGRGICNSNGNCHCEKGWAPPFCIMPGKGGSTDSQNEVDEKCECSN